MPLGRIFYLGEGKLQFDFSFSYLVASPSEDVAQSGRNQLLFAPKGLCNLAQGWREAATLGLPDA
ncbi:MAG: hypothetical protein BECKG1743D_GA0114223_104132 [Candidatus Kentron sp. G]|nr:MAG: hypothetical protein BECKG1743F_GA0114225_101854 [Candidatus Kentron sp. G]VFN01274.1 MAG: hypothetical protein BECKG1743E_GA0114224_103954 [Candidatus Kentron sp. G]VFN02941.1 MAG: hypothetical protein BECKG1743D_GA0114223_104132 [Candidatus Kentron sp. G]